MPVDSFSDIAFLLIIFFILATSLTQIMGVKADMPAGEKSEKQAEEKVKSVALRDGQIFYNDKPTDMAQLREALNASRLDLAEGENKVVLLEASGQVPWQQQFSVMTAITKAGGIIALVEEEEEGGSS